MSTHFPNPMSEPSTVSPAILRDVWRASELARARCTTQSTGHARLDAELPDGGWPRSSLVELLVQQNGIGEVQLLRPCLEELTRQRRLALVQPPYLPHAMACRAWQINERHLLWLRPQSSADALWATEQLLKNGSCGGVILWQSHVRPDALRRLNLAAQGAETWFWLVRPLAAAADASPASLRVALRPAAGGISADIVKRRGPHCEAPIFISYADVPHLNRPDGIPDETDALRVPAAVAPRSLAPLLV